MSFVLLIPHIAISQPDSLWSRTYGELDRDLIYCTRQTSDGGFISTGYFTSSDYPVVANSRKLWLLKTDSQGVLDWSRLYGEYSNNAGYWVEQTSDGGYIIGLGFYDFQVIKTDANGNVTWSYISNESGGYSICRCVKETYDGGYILCGKVEFLLDEILLVKLDSNGQEEWSRVFNGGSFSWDYATYVEQTPDSGFIVTGRFSDYYSDESSLFLLKTNEIGEEEWCNYYGEDSYFSGECVHHLNGNGYIAVGKYGHPYSGYDLWLLRTDEMGNTVWSKRYGGAEDDFGTNVELTDDSCFFATGYTFSMGAGEEDVYAVKVDMTGQLLWQRTFGGTERDIGWSGEQLDDGGYIISGYTYSFDQGPYYDGWLIRLESDLGIETPLPQDELSISTSPSPFTTDLNINLVCPSNADVSVRIFDSAGRLVDTVFQGTLQQEESTIQWIAPDETPTGCYLVNLQAGSHSITDKCVLLR